MSCSNNIKDLPSITCTEPIEHEGHKYFIDNLGNLYNEDRTINALAHEVTYNINGKDYLGTELAQMIENDTINQLNQ